MQHPPDGRLARLTATAVGRAAALSAMVGADEVSAVLYRAGGTAVEPGQDPRLPRLLCDRAEAGVRAELRQYDRSRSEHWDGWTVAGADADDLVHKIYVSPTVAALPAALPIVFAVAVDLTVPSWKVGADGAGIHRADKIVLYLPTSEEADEAAGVLAAALADLPAQGVPFTGQVGRSGIVSRGQDFGRQSWRAAVCTSVGRALLARRASLGPQAPAAQVAAEALDGLAADIDVVTWWPGQRVPA
ncbi:MAG: hypothetical protein AAGC49_12130 [Brevundimonas sp.]